MEKKFYVVVRQSPHYHQMTLEELIAHVPVQTLLVSNEENTKTYEVENVSETLKRKFGISKSALIAKLKIFNQETEYLRAVDRHELFRTFYIPKRSGGLRKIDAPNADLMNHLRTLKTFFEEDCKVLYHTSAFAYIKKRCTIDAVKRHQSNESRWFAKFDLSNFFGSTTLDFVMNMFSMVYPLSEIVDDIEGEPELRKALELAFLDGGLPQGTPISPFITNTMMIPVDFALTKKFRDFEYEFEGEKRKNRCVYTRYADDFIVSSRYDFSFRAAENAIKEVLSDFEAPFSINSKKTRYGSSSGANWNLGVMLNAENKITIGHKKKKVFSAMISSYALDKMNGKRWDINDIQVLEGLRSYYRMVEMEGIDNITDHYSNKYGFNIVESIKNDFRGVSSS